MRNNLATPEQILPVNLLIIQATPFCNIDCNYCYLPDRLSTQKISLQTLDAIFSKVFESPFTSEKLSIVWHAGEPLAMPIKFYRQAIELANKLNRKNIQLTHSFQSNGTLLNQAWCDLIKEEGIKIGLSVDGPSFIHDEQRRTRLKEGTHAKVMQAIGLLRKNNISFHIISVLTSLSLNYPDDIYNFFVGTGATSVGFNIEEVEGTHTYSSLQSPELERKYQDFMSRLYYLSKTEPILNIREFDTLRQFVLYGSNISLKQQSNAFAILSVDCNGNFSAFSPELLTMKNSIYGDFILGNFLVDDLEDAVNTQKFQQLNSDIQQGIAKCRNDCSYFALCGGGAPSNKYFENGSFASTETMHCRFTRQKIIDILLPDIEYELGLEAG
jgi:uncharacterized protein